MSAEKLMGQMIEAINTLKEVTKENTTSVNSLNVTMAGMKVDLESVVKKTNEHQGRINTLEDGQKKVMAIASVLGIMAGTAGSKVLKMLGMGT